MRETMTPPRANPKRVAGQLLAGLDPGALKVILAEARERTFAASQVLFRTGEPAERLYLLLSGRVRFSRVSTTGRDVVMAVLAPGDVCGLGSLIGPPVDYYGTATSLEQSEMLMWNHAAIQRLATAYPLLSQNALRVALHYIAHFIDRQLRLLSSTAEQRLAGTLIRLGTTAGNAVTFPGTYKGKLVMLDFWATWCGPCKMIAPHVAALAQEFAGRAVIGKLNVDENPQIAARYGIMSIPTLLIFKGGKMVDQIVGVQPAQRPRQPAQQDLLEDLARPHVFAMAHRGVEHAALSVVLAPGDREMAELLLVVRMLVQDEEVAGARAKDIEFITIRGNPETLGGITAKLGQADRP